jgi:hypothetical protein
MSPADLIRGHGRTFGAIVSGVVALGALYECLAILTPLPTISREWQGLRDSSPFWAETLGWAAGALCAVIVGFAGWLLHHFREDRRSSL